MNEIVNRNIEIRFTGKINCIETGKNIRKTYGEGLCYDAWLTSPAAAPSVIHPELSRIHEGVALRDFEWEMKYHNCAHIVYLSYTDKVKVGVTRSTNRLTRWIDQGAGAAVVLAETPYRQLAGQIEVFLKDFIADKTSWQAMITSGVADSAELLKQKSRIENLLEEDLGEFISDDNIITHIHYPLNTVPRKIASVKLDRRPIVAGTLTGIKGQYLIFSTGDVINIRSHAGYEVEIDL
jgi:hypothetical protein